MSPDNKIQKALGVFFTNLSHPLHKQYEALRALCVERKSVREVAKMSGYTELSINSLKRDFKQRLQNGLTAEYYFKDVEVGRKNRADKDAIREIIIKLRKQNISILDIKSALQSQDILVSHDFIYQVVSGDGFTRLPKRTVMDKKGASSKVLAAPRSIKIDWAEDEGKIFYTEQGAGILAFLPLIKELKIDRWVEEAKYPGTKDLGSFEMVLSFLALKLSGNERYSKDNLWALDRGFGLFSGLNVLPKNSSLSTYSYRISRDMNLSLLRNMFNELNRRKLLSGVTNLDFTSIPHWGDESVLENNWSGTRGKALKSVLSVLAQDPASGVICYSDAEIKHKNQNDSVLEFADFYRKDGAKISCLVFDSKFTTYENLEKLDRDGIEFITIRRRQGKLVPKTLEIPAEEWIEVTLERSARKKQSVKVHDSEITLKNIDTKFRQIIMTNHGRQKPTFIITNNRTLTAKQVIQRYSKRWNVEKTISEQISFFHLNSLSSSIVVKVDFDLTMSVLAHNLYRIMADNFDGFEKQVSGSLNDKFFINGAQIKLEKSQIIIEFKKKRHLPILLEALKKYQNVKVPWLNNLPLVFKTWAVS